MKNKIDFYTWRLIKENYLYIIVFCFFLFLALFFIPLQMINYFNHKEKTGQLIKEVNILTKKKTVVYSIDSEEISKLIQTLDNLIPNNEDYFSIFSTLNNILAKTGFTISSFSIKFSEKPQNKLVVQVNGEGTSNSFFHFLDTYQYGGGRLITIDKLEFSPTNYKATLNLNFYTKVVQNVKQTDNLIVNGRTLTEIKKINQEIISGYISATVEGHLKEIEYQTKQNPFEL